MKKEGVIFVKGKSRCLSTEFTFLAMLEGHELEKELMGIVSMIPDFT